MKAVLGGGMTTKERKPMRLEYLLGTVGLATLIALATASPARATTIATISGCYDCGVFDTPSIFFNIDPSISLINAQMVLNGYDGDNNGLTATVIFGTLTSASPHFFWGSAPIGSGGPTPGVLTTYDYDDMYTSGPNWLGGLYPNCNSPLDTSNTAQVCAPGGGPTWYAQVGNFRITFTATISGGPFNGQPVFSVFSPDTNATGGFVGFEGVDPQGFSDNPLYDVHTGVVTGELADINLGLPPSTVPEPTTISLLGLGLGLLAHAGRRRMKN